MEDDYFHLGVDELIYLENMLESDSDDDEVYAFSSDDEEDAFVDAFVQFYEDENMQTNTSNQCKKTEIDNQTRKKLAQVLLHSANEHFELPRGTISKVASNFGRHRTTISRFWNKLVKWQALNGSLIDVKHKKKGRCGRKEKVWDEERLKTIPQKQRTTIRQFAEALGVTHSVIIRLLKKGIIKSHTSSMKPSLTEKHKIQRMEWILGMIVLEAIPGIFNQPPRFQLLCNVVHIDEKWFWLSRLVQRYYLLTDEEEPIRHTQSKNFIPKVMFIAAVARPQFNSNKECIFEGKIGIWPFTEEHIAQRTSVNRERGTIEIRARHSVTRDIIKQAIITQIIPAIKEKWPTEGTKCIWIQQDNARPHISPNDADFIQAANTDGFNMHLICQPAQSPDLNVLDLGFFNGI